MAGSDDLVDRRVSVNARDRRVRLGLSQTEVAERMQESGHRWYAPAVVGLEQGRRRIKLSEAVDLARILGTDLPGLMRAEAADSAEAAAALDRLTHRVEESRAALDVLVRAVRDVIRRRLELVVAVSDARRLAESYPEMSDMIAEADQLLDLEPHQLVESLLQDSNDYRRTEAVRKGLNSGKR